jgi:hypothetical protein
MKKRFLIFLFLFSLASVPLFVFAQATINPAIPGMGTVSSTTPPGAWVSKIYDFALMIGGVLAFGAIVYGGVLYAASMGNPSKQSEGKEWVTSALLGVLLLGGAYLILYTINPDLVNLNLPNLTAINITGTLPMPGTGGTILPGGSAKLSQADAAKALAAAGITVNNPNTTSLNGMRTDTVLEAVRMQGLCKCNPPLVATAGTEPDNHGVAANGVDHVDGYKIDIRATNELVQNGVTNFIMNDKTDFTDIGPRSGDGAERYKDNSTGAIWAYEASKGHWDVTAP